MEALLLLALPLELAFMKFVVEFGDRSHALFAPPDVRCSPPSPVSPSGISVLADDASDELPL